MKTGITFIFFLCSLKFYSQNKSFSFDLVSGSKIKTIKKKNFIHLESSDNSEFVGDFIFLADNKIYIKPVTYREPDGHYKIFEDSASPVGVDISTLNRVIKDRTTLTSISGGVFWASAITAFVISPLVSIQKDKTFNWNKCLTISGISAATALLSIGVFLVFEEQSFYLKAIDKKRRLWTIRQ